MKGIQIITDKNHQMTEVEIFPALHVSGGATFDFSKTAVAEDFIFKRGTWLVSGKTKYCIK